jgi:putative ABC transport system permease protein
VGILAPTGTPVDQTLHVPLEGITAMHVGWETGTRNPLADTLSESVIRSFDLTPKTVTAVFVGLVQKGTLLRTRRAINSDRQEPLLAIIPSQALAELWAVMGNAERLLLAISGFVVAVGLVSILTSLLTSLNERRREMSILRATGARPSHILFLMLAEAGGLGLAGGLIGMGLIQLIFSLTAPLLTASYGIALPGTGLSIIDGATLLTVTVAAILIGVGPALVALRRSLADGLSVKV